jgi:hypothetical protein
MHFTSLVEQKHLSCCAFWSKLSWWHKHVHQQCDTLGLKFQNILSLRDYSSVAQCQHNEVQHCDWWICYFSLLCHLHYLPANLRLVFVWLSRMLETSVTLGTLQKLSEVFFVCILKTFQNLHQIGLSHVFISLVTVIIPWDHMLVSKIALYLKNTRGSKNKTVRISYSSEY